MTIDESGQHVMSCLGELHLEQCLKALSDKFALCPVRASPPLEIFRETVCVGNYSNGGEREGGLPLPWSELNNVHLASNGE